MRATVSTTVLASVSAARHVTDRRRVVMFSRAWVTPGWRASAVSISQTQAAHCSPSIIRCSEAVPSAPGLAWGA